MPKLTEELAGPLRQMQVGILASVCPNVCLFDYQTADGQCYVMFVCYQSLCQSNCLAIGQSVSWLLFFLTIGLSDSAFVFLSVCPSVKNSVCLSPSPPSVSQSVSQSISQSKSQSVSQISNRSLMNESTCDCFGKC